MAAKISLVQSATAVGRRNRNPRYQHLTVNSPWEIVPFMCAPVLAGETMSSLLVQQSVQMAALKPTISGWWLETFFFYVKHRDLADRDLLSEMHVANASTASLVEAASQPWYHAVGINWLKKCYVRIVEEYFRDEGEAWDVATSPSGYAMARLDRSNWLDSAILDGFVADTDEDQLPGDEIQTNLYEAHSVPAGYEAHFDTWLQMRRARLVAVDFEDYLKAHGIKVAQDKVEPHRPELIRYEKDWQTPKFWTVPTTGDAAAQVRWDQSLRADKDRFFSEPGFIVGLNVIRPKIMMANAGMIGSAIGLLRDAFSWLPAMLNDEPETSLMKIDAADAAAIFPGYSAGTEDVWIDVKDLFLYGEDFTNIAPADADSGIDRLVAQDFGPDVSFNRRYPSTSVYDFFIGAPLISAGDPEADPPTEDVFADLGPIGQQSAAVAEGVTSLTIKSRIIDTSGVGNNG